MDDEGSSGYGEGDCEGVLTHEVMVTKFYSAPVTPEEFLAMLEKKIENSQEQSFFTRQTNYINYKGIQVKDNYIILEKDGPPFEKRYSPYYGFSGTIKARYEEVQGHPRFEVQFYPESGLRDFVQIAFSIAVFLILVTYLIFDFSWAALFFSILGFGILQIILAATKFEYTRNFELYFNGFIADVLRK